MQVMQNKSSRNTLVGKGSLLGENKTKKRVEAARPWVSATPGVAVVVVVAPVSLEQFLSLLRSRERRNHCCIFRDKQ